jgi:hypothetical protein
MLDPALSWNRLIEFGTLVEFTLKNTSSKEGLGVNHDKEFYPTAYPKEYVKVVINIAIRN